MNRPTRLGALAVLFAACAAYGSFVPLLWRPVSWSAGLTQFVHLPFTPFEHLWTGDFVTNVLLFLPIGLFALGWMTSRAVPNVGATPDGTNRSRAAQLLRPAVVVLSCAFFSLALEVGQTYIVARTPSWSDVFGQTVGAILGVTLWLIAGTRLVTWAASPLRAHSRDERLYQILELYAAGWAVLAALPILFPKLAHPMLNDWRASTHLSPLTLLGPLVIAGVGALPLGAFGAHLSRRRSWRGVAAAAGGLVLLVLADRVRQVQFMPTEGHLAASLVGFAIGWLVAARSGERIRSWCSTRATLVGATALVATICVLVLRYLAPFDFGVRPAVVEWRIRILYERAPFHRYYWTPPLIALGEMITLMLLAGLSAGLLRRLRPRGLSIATCSVLTTLLFAAIEWGQLYLPARRADPTDLMLAAVGAFAGAVVARALELSPPPPAAS